MFFILQIKEMSAALTRDKELTLKIESQVEAMRRYKDSAHLTSLMALVEDLLGRHHILMAILRGAFALVEVGDEDAGLMPSGLSSKFLSDSVHAAINGQTPGEVEVGNGIVATTGAAGAAASDPGSAAAKTGVAAVASAAGLAAASRTSSSSKVVVAREVNANGTKTVAKETIKYNPLGTDVFLETGKVVGQNSTRLAGQVIVGVSAAFLLWDAIDLGWTVTDLIRKKGSQAGKILRDKADELEEALKETTENYSVEMVHD